MTKTKLLNIVQRIPLIFHGQGGQAEFDTMILVGDVTIIYMEDEIWFNNEQVARYKLYLRLCKEL